MKKTETPLALVNENTGEIMQSEHIASAEMEIQATIILAKKFPRNEERSFEKLTKSCQRLSFAEEAEYSFPRGGKAITGPSVNLAREAARTWGNIRYGLKIVQDSEDEVTIEGWAWDIETNTKVSSQDSFAKLHQRKSKTTGKAEWVTPDERDLRELINRRGAISIRNSILQLLPRDLIEDAQAECRKTRQKKNKGMSPEKLMKEWIKAFSNLRPFGVTVEQLEKYLKHPLKECSSDEWDNLKMIYTSINDGNSTWQEYAGDNGDKQKEEIRGNLNVEDLKTKEEEPEKDTGISVEYAIEEVGKQTTLLNVNAIWDKYPSLQKNKDFLEAISQIKSNIKTESEAQEAHEAGEQMVIDDERKKPTDGRNSDMFDNKK